MSLSNNARGILLAGGGVFILSPDSLLIRLIDIDLWTLMFWRGLFMGLSLLLLNLIIDRGAPLQAFRRLDKYALAIAIFMTISSFFFVSSIQTTSVAHTLIIVGSVPVAAAILGIIFLRQQVTGNSWLTIVVVVTGLGFVVYDNSHSNLLGDFYALMTCLLLAMNFILANLTRVKNMIAVMSLGGFLIALASFPLANFGAITTQQLLLCMLVGTIVGVSFSLITLAPRYIPSAEVAIFMPLETVFGSLLVWLFVGENPGIVSLTAGAVIICAIMLNSYYQIRKASNGY